jgi:hypothetical protein
MVDPGTDWRDRIPRELVEPYDRAISALVVLMRLRRRVSKPRPRLVTTARREHRKKNRQVGAERGTSPVNDQALEFANELQFLHKTAHNAAACLLPVEDAFIAVESQGVKFRSLSQLSFHSLVIALASDTIRRILLTIGLSQEEVTSAMANGFDPGEIAPKIASLSVTKWKKMQKQGIAEREYDLLDTRLKKELVRVRKQGFNKTPGEPGSAAANQATGV